MNCATAIMLALTMASAESHESAEPQTLSPDVRESLQKNSAVFASIFIAGEKTRRLLTPAETVLKAFQANESADDFMQPLTFELRFKGKQFRESIEYPPGVGYKTDYLHEISFDGAKM